MVHVKLHRIIYTALSLLDLKAQATAFKMKTRNFLTKVGRTITNITITRNANMTNELLQTNT